MRIVGFSLKLGNGNQEQRRRNCKCLGVMYEIGEEGA